MDPDHTNQCDNPSNSNSQVPPTESVDYENELDSSLVSNSSQDKTLWNTSIVSLNESDSALNSSSNCPTSAKKIKLSKEEKAAIAEERERIRIEREKLKNERAKAKLEREKARLLKEKEKVERDARVKEEREQKLIQMEKEKQQKREQKEWKLKMDESRRRQKEEQKNKLKEAREQQLLELQRQKEEKAAQDEEKVKQNEMKLEKSRAVLFKFLKTNKNPEKKSNTDPVTCGPDTKIDSVPVKSFFSSLRQSFRPDEFEDCIKKQDVCVEHLFLNQVLTNQIQVKVNSCDFLENKDIVEELPGHLKHLKLTFLQFFENVRPAFFGARPLNLNNVDPKSPFVKGEHIDYEVDSDQEWDDGGPGESLSASESENENEKDDYEIDNDFFVPHGYLSDDENEVLQENETKSTSSGPLMKEQTLMAERNRRFAQSLVPQVIGCVWQNGETPLDAKYDILKQFNRVTLPK